MRYTFRRLSSVAVGAMLCVTGAVYAAPTLDTSEESVVVRSVEPMTLGEWTEQRELVVQEDDPFGGWDCRVNGNERCGTRQYASKCESGHTDCVLEGVDVNVSRD